MRKKLDKNYFLHHNVIELGRSLIGKYLITCLGPDNIPTGGMIIEAESYKGAEDKASHAYNNRRTKRTETMFAEGGVAYVYLCYGMHHLFNVVTNREGTPDAVLIRAIKPEIGINLMLKRRNKTKVDKTLTNGPGTVCQALGIKKEHNGMSLLGKHIWIEDRGIFIPDDQILATPRIGIDYAEEDILNPWRFVLAEGSVS